MSTFEPSTIIAILKNAAAPADKKHFEKNWNESVEKRVTSWKVSRSDQTQNEVQLTWNAHVVEYVNNIYGRTTVHANSSKGTVADSLPKDILILGPRFVPPSYLHVEKRQKCPAIEPMTSYLKPLIVVHPFYYPGLAKCPQCDSINVKWDSWTTKGHREVHGIRQEECALGMQLRCKDCEMHFGKGKGGDPTKGKYCFATTNALFWERREAWEMPRGIPYFLKRCALTRELFDMIIELRPSSTSAGLAENIKQLHLLEYRQCMLEYLRSFEGARQNLFKKCHLQQFSAPNSTTGYDDSSISAETITEAYLEFGGRTRQEESSEFLRTLTGICISVDNTFRSAGKASIADSKKKRTKVWKGGMMSMLNERGLTLNWVWVIIDQSHPPLLMANVIATQRLAQTNSPTEIQEALDGVNRRCDELGVERPVIVTADNCCHIRNSVSKSLPHAEVVLDVYHFLMRFLVVIVNGTKNHHRAEVASDITGAILKKRAVDGKGAEYWTKEEQAVKLEAAFEKWSRKGGVWSAAAAQVYADQMNHVRKGCLTRTRQDIRTDGSRIEGSHKGWNSLQRAQPSGIVVYVQLGHDHILRRNIRIATSGNKTSPFKSFEASTFGSHHIRLVNCASKLWNKLRLGQSNDSPGLLALPELKLVASGETFGLVSSEHAATFGGLLAAEEAKEEPKVEDDLLRLDADEEHAENVENERLRLLDELNIEPHLLALPLVQNSPASALNTRHANSPSSSSHHQDLNLTPAAGINAGLKRRVAEPIDLTLDEPVSKRARTDTDEVSEVAGPSTTPSITVHSFFASKRLANNADKPTTAITAAVPLPDATGLTRSQRLFSISTGIHIQSLRIGRGPEFFLFMKLRSQHKWASFKMTPSKWVEATKLYNSEAVKLDQLRGSNQSHSYIAKNPRALMLQLGMVEATISDRVITGNYKSMKGTEAFWREHCHAVPLMREDQLDRKSRKPASCPRCKKIMYPGPTGAPENHKRGCCSDGVKSKPPDNTSSNYLPHWPQPNGIFSGGTSFNPQAFLSAVREIYEKVVMGTGGGDGISMEYVAFAEMLQKRTSIRADGSVVFLLYPEFTVDSCPDEWVIKESSESGDETYLRMDCLRNN